MEQTFKIYDIGQEENAKSSKSQPLVKNIVKKGGALIYQ